MPVADLLVIAGLPVVDVSAKEGAYAASQEIGRLVAVASRLSSEQVRELITRAEGQVE